MKITESFSTSVKAILLNKVRAFLTMLGVIIGVFSVIVLISIGRGIQNYMTDQFNALGSNLLFVAPGRVAVGSDPGRAASRNKFEKKHVDLINLFASQYIEAVSPYTETGDTVTYKNKSFYAGVSGLNYRAGEIFSYELDGGRYYSKSEEDAKAQVVVLGKSVVNELFPNKSPLGSYIKINSQSYKVIGTLKEKGKNFDDLVIVPYTAALETFNIKNYSSIVIKVRDSNDIDLATREVKMALLRDLKPDDFTVMSQKDILSSIQNILRIFTLGLGVIAGISLVVGGIGIMNIMLVSVTERTREIGLRKALGATPINIAIQFLFESILLSVNGGIIGIILGYLASLGARVFLRTEVPWWSVAIAFGFSVLVGVAFGTYPAIKASKKDPIEALRFE